MRLRLVLVSVPLVVGLACSDDGFAPAGDEESGGNPTTGIGSGESFSAGDDETSAATSGGDTTGEIDGTTGSPPDPSTTGMQTGTTGPEVSTGGSSTGDDSSTGSSTGDSSSSDSSGSSGSSSSSDGGMMVECPDIAGTSLIGGPADLYGYCWYITAPMDTCDSACAELAGGANLALAAEGSYPDNCLGPVAGDVPTWFFDNGNPAGWTSMGGETTGHTLGYGYSIVGNFYGKCSTGGTEIGTYPGEMVGGGLEAQRQLVCACAEGTP